MTLDNNDVFFSESFGAHQVTAFYHCLASPRLAFLDSVSTMFLLAAVVPYMIISDIQVTLSTRKIFTRLVKNVMLCEQMLQQISHKVCMFVTSLTEQFQTATTVKMSV